jgi:NDP-sugar pyrophosphorylase family protein
MVPALVLTAGLATRLRPLSFVRAKAALPVAGTPLIHRILRSLSSAGVRDVVLNLHHLPHTLTRLLGDGTGLEMSIRYSWEVPVLGSAGGPKRAIQLLASPAAFARSATASRAEAERRRGSRTPSPESRVPSPGTFLILNGDTLTDINLRAVIDDHQRSGALVTMAVVPNTEPQRYGGVVVAADGSVTGFVRRGSTQPSSHFVGVQVAEPEAFASVPPDVPYETVGALYPALLSQRPGAIRAYQTTGEFMDIGTPSDYLDTSLTLATREGIDMAAGAAISRTARVERSILWDDVVVEDGAMLRECVVTDGVRVPADTSWHGVTIRNASGELAPSERRIDGLAIASL